MSEFEPSVVTGELIDRKPFVIRAHHLNIYTLLVTHCYGPSGLAKGIRRRIEKEWQESLLLKNGDDNSKPAKYGKDVLGVGDQADKVEESLTLTLETFLHLSDSHPAVIVEGIPDTICGGCAIGKHCRKLFNNDYHKGKKNTFKKDRECIDLFLKSLDDLNLPKSTIIQGRVSFSDAEPQQVRRVRTTIGIVKDVLREGKNFM